MSLSYEFFSTIPLLLSHTVYLSFSQPMNTCPPRAKPLLMLGPPPKILSSLLALISSIFQDGSQSRDHVVPSSAHWDLRYVSLAFHFCAHLPGESQVSSVLWVSIQVPNTQGHLQKLAVWAC